MSVEGISEGALLQRGEDGFSIGFFRSGEKITTARYDGRRQGCAAVYPLGEGRYRLEGIPTGGPYTLTIGENRFESVYVGDLWLLGGQSNMAGVGHTTREDCDFGGDPEVRAFYMTDHWDAANHPLHATGWAVDEVHTRVIGSGYPNYEACIGPGLSFARRMKALTGVPQGVICCAHSGTSLSQWDPALRHLGGAGSLYGAMLRRFHACGGRVKGLFWYQGCNDAEEQAHRVFTGKLTALIEACRRDFGTEGSAPLPIVQVQIGRVTNRVIPLHEAWWNSIREQQRQVGEKLPAIATLSVLSKELDDAVHLSSAAQRRLGEEAAEAMHCLLDPTSREGSLPPRFKEVCLCRGHFNGWAEVRVRYEGLRGGLIAPGRPLGFVIREAEGKPETQYVHRIALEGDTAVLYSDRLPEELLGGQLYYGRGADPCCNITDEAGRDLPGMGPILLDRIEE